jgi:plastocyanin
MARSNGLATEAVAQDDLKLGARRRGIRDALSFLIVAAAASVVSVSSCNTNGGPGAGGGQGTSDGSGAGSTGGSSQGGSPGTGGSGGDVCAAAPGAVENGCHTNGDDATDERGMGPQTITFGVGSNTYDPKCLLIDANQTVTFDGDFSEHPLTSGEIRDATECPDNGVLTFGGAGPKTFTLAPGVYPYYCRNHGPGGMDGLVIVDAGSGGSGGSGAGGSPGTGGTGGT